MTVVRHGIVTVVQSWAEREGSPYYLDYAALVLRNTSPHLAALGVRVKLYVGQSTFPLDQETLTGIPAGGSFYLDYGGAMNSGGSRLTDLRISVNTERTSAGRLLLPSVTMTIKRGSLLPQAYGVVSNPYRGANATNWDASQFGGLFVVYFNRQGKLIGGDQEDLARISIPRPGATSHFVMGVAPPSGATTAKASIDPCDTGFNGLSPSDCVALQ